MDFLGNDHICQSSLFYFYDRGLLAILQAGFCLLLVFFTVPETFRPVLLAQKAQRIRKETGDNRYYAPSEAKQITMRNRLYNILAMPFKILFLEPMLIAITVYQSVSSCPVPLLMSINSL